MIGKTNVVNSGNKINGIIEELITEDTITIGDFVEKINNHTGIDTQISDS